MSEPHPPYCSPLLQTNQSNNENGQHRNPQSSQPQVAYFVPPPSSRTHTGAQPMILVQPSPGRETTSYDQQPQSSQLTRRRSTDLTCLALAVCLFCFLPTGICAMYFAEKAKSKLRQGCTEEAKRNLRCSLVFIILSIVLGIVVGIVVTIFAVRARETKRY